MIEDNDIILKQASRVLTPFILIYGIYITFHGHLTPGGGFSGGTVIAASLILNRISNGNRGSGLNIDRMMGIASIALVCYGLIKAMGTFFPDFAHRALPRGIPGDLLSGGAILPLNIAVGMVVACVMYTFFCLIGEEA